MSSFFQKCIPLGAPCDPCGGSSFSQEGAFAVSLDVPEDEAEHAEKMLEALDYYPHIRKASKDTSPIRIVLINKLPHPDRELDLRLSKHHTLPVWAVVDGKTGLARVILPVVNAGNPQAVYHIAASVERLARCRRISQGVGATKLTLSKMRNNVEVFIHVHDKELVSWESPLRAGDGLLGSRAYPVPVCNSDEYFIQFRNSTGMKLVVSAVRVDPDQSVSRIARVVVSRGQTTDICGSRRAPKRIVVPRDSLKIAKYQQDVKAEFRFTVVLFVTRKPKVSQQIDLLEQSGVSSSGGVTNLDDFELAPLPGMLYKAGCHHLPIHFMALTSPEDANGEASASQHKQTQMQRSKWHRQARLTDN